MCVCLLVEYMYDYYCQHHTWLLLVLTGTLLRRILRSAIWQMGSQGMCCIVQSFAFLSDKCINHSTVYSGCYWSKRWWGGSGISWTICKSFAPRCRQITTPVPHHSDFTGRMPFLPPNQQCQSTEGTAYASINIVIMSIPVVTFYLVLQYCWFGHFWPAKNFLFQPFSRSPVRT